MINRQVSCNIHRTISHPTEVMADADDEEVELSDTFASQLFTELGEPEVCESVPQRGLV